jgi:N-6 DNA Methylase
MPLLNKRILNKFYAKSEHFKNEPKFHELKKYFGEINSRIEKKDFGNESSERQEFISCFLKILGYKFNDNFWFENATMNGRSIDACIGTNINNTKKVEVAIEWKGVDTKYLDKKINSREESPVSQMWDYMGKEAAHIGIVSNFEEIRIYCLNKGQVEYQLYTLKNLVNDDKLLIEFYSLLRFDMLLKGVKNISKFEELVLNSDAEQELITKEFYRDYKKCRIALYSHLVENNNDNKNILLEKTQKILDRLIFIMFCEDSPAFLLNSGTIKNNYSDVMKSFTNDEQKVWNSFKGLFEYIDKGNDYHGINAFNGGLFAEDQELNNLVIKNDIWKQLTALAEYDFASDLDVNILGHIFEQSIADIENIKNEINGIEPKKKKKTIRNKDGIFYTPEYITEYIVENTIGEWLKENPEGLDTIKVLDPAGGSGAFLNQAHTYLAKAQAEALNQKIAADGFDNLADQDAYSIDKSILNNNLYMVDLQPESVEIAKLSLWLKTASKEHKLNNLDSNIKCGNSLIDDPQVAGIRAFKWNQEFPTVMENGGFDVIIGNPPYVMLSETLSISGTDNFNAYIQFSTMSLDNLKNNGYLGFIIPTTWMSQVSYLNFRKKLIDKYTITKIIQLPYDIFEAYVDTVILIVKKSANINKSDIEVANFKIHDVPDLNQIKKNYVSHILGNNNSLIIDSKILIIQDKLSNTKFVKLGEISEINRGTLPPKLHEFSTIKTDKFYYPYFNGQINRYETFPGDNLFIDPQLIGESKSVNFFDEVDILARQLVTRKFKLQFQKSKEKFAFKKNLYGIKITNNIWKSNSLLAVLNSNIFSYLNVFSNVAVQRDDFPSFSLQEFKNFNIPLIDNITSNILNELVINVLNFKNRRFEISNKFVSLIYSKYLPKVISTKLKAFYKLEFSEFLAELKKQKVKIESLSAESELLQYFEQEKKKINELKIQIDQVDDEIEALVIKLYGLEGIDLEI